MFGNKKRLEQKLSTDGGAVAWATIISAETAWTSGSTNSADVYAPGNNKHMEVRVKVEPEGEPAFEATFHQMFAKDFPLPGWRAKVIYDPSDHSKIAIQEGEIVAPSGPLSFTVTDGGVEQPDAAAALTALFTGGSSAQPDVGDELTKLADLRDRGALTEDEFQAQKAKLLSAD